VTQEPDLNPQSRVVALVGSPRRQGNTVFAVGLATQELERRGVTCETVMLCDLPSSVCDGDSEGETRAGAEGDVEALLDRVWAADGLILATPVYFSNVSAQMKAFMDGTNDRFLNEQWLTPKIVGLLVIGGQGGFTDTVHALRRYLDFMAPCHPPVEVADGHADAIGEAQRSSEVRTAALAMAEHMADVLLGGGARGAGSGP
jgi:multimeric flavodoxin WrbA